MTETVGILTQPLITYYNNNNSIYNSDILCLCHLTANYIYDYI